MSVMVHFGMMGRPLDFLSATNCTPTSDPSTRTNSHRRKASPVEDRSRKNSLLFRISSDPSTSSLAPVAETSMRKQLRRQVPSIPMRLTGYLCSRRTRSARRAPQAIKNCLYCCRNLLCSSHQRGARPVNLSVRIRGVRFHDTVYGDGNSIEIRRNSTLSSSGRWWPFDSRRHDVLMRTRFVRRYRDISKSPDESYSCCASHGAKDISL